MISTSLPRACHRSGVIFALVVTVWAGVSPGRRLWSAEPNAGLAAAEIEFNRDIRPLLSQRCFACHGPDDTHREADLRLDDRRQAMADRGGHAAIVPGDVAASELWQRVSSDDEDLRMPPADSGKQLSPEELQLLRRWIEQGAEWSAHWAYEPPARHPLPLPPASLGEGLVASSRAGNWIDRFIQHTLTRQGLAPAPPSDPVTLLRRVSFDLTGLPPTLDQVEEFSHDRSPQAWQQVVDRLLQSPAFGERMAIYWLDLVRYADTVGYHGDQDHNISPYRDYVIQAFNEGLPFDQFTREQLAGDLLDSPRTEQLIATGYNRLLQTSHEGGVQPKEYLAIYAADRVRNLSLVWMAATVGCAQCHNHKFDPYTITDFYALAAFFADVDEEAHFRVGSNDLPTNRPPEMEVLSMIDLKNLAAWREEQGRLEAMLQRAEPAASGEGGIAVGNASTNVGSQRELIEGQLHELAERVAELQARKRKSMITVALPEPRTVRVLPRGNWLDDSGPIVQPAVPEFLPPLTVGERRATRLDLANWLTDPADGAGALTARVMVNRLWYLCFGQGLSPSLDDFGAQGQPPTHPELLDNLAWEFIDSGWDVKHLLRLIVTSQTYQQSSDETDQRRAGDPLNRWYSRQNRFRLPAEMIRDNALSVSGLLVSELGGSSVKPYQPAGYYRHLNFPTREYQADKDQRQWRRGLYVHWQRQFLHPMLKAFDAPSREECTVRRPRSNTPLAALVLLNDPTFVEAASAYASHIMREGGTSDESRVRFAFQTAVSRAPDEQEQAVLLQLLRSWRATATDVGDDVLAVAAAATLYRPPPALDASEHAAWTAVARACLNLGEFVTRN